MNKIKLTKIDKKGFTIVELLIVIVIIGILAALILVTYNGVNARAAQTRQTADVTQYYNAIILARQNTGLTLPQITGSSWSVGGCSTIGNNTADVEPKNLPKTSPCWTNYYSNLSKIGAAAGESLNNLRPGDINGNPYALDENELDGGKCQQDIMYAFPDNGTADGAYVVKYIPLSQC